MDGIDKMMSEETAYKEIAETYFLSARQVALILKVSLATANRRIKEVKTAIDCKKYSQITLLNLCKHYDLTPKSAFLSI
jgi:hypothetical protein